MDLVPKKPIPFGSNSVYPKKEITYPLEFFHKHRWSIHNKYIENTMNYEKIRQLERAWSDGHDGWCATNKTRR